MAPARALPTCSGRPFKVRRASVAPLRLGAAPRDRRDYALRGAGLCTAQENGLQCVHWFPRRARCCAELARL